MKYRKSLLTGLLLLLFVWTDAPAQTEPDRRRAETEKILRAIHEKQKNVGLAAAVYRGGKPVYTGELGFADLEQRVPVRRDTRFQVASVTKAFTGAALVRLLARGKIQPDADIRKHLPEFPKRSGTAITAELLAVHMAGIRHYRDGEKTAAFLSTHYPDPASAVRIFSADELTAEPGTKYGYSSYGYNLLALLIEKAAGRPFTEFVEAELFTPLGLRNASFNDVRYVLANRARHYSFYDPLTYAPSEALFRVPDFDYSYNQGGGNIITTAEDLARFGQAFTEEGFFSRRELELLYRKPRSESPWGYGWFIREKTADEAVRLHITGAFPGVQAGLYVFPADGLSVAVISNTWGVGSNSGEMVSDVPQKIAAVWKD